MSERRLKSPLPEQVERNQRRASDPAAHVWVTANAGSGKTHVLTQRVLRLLLAGVSPQSILCLTYTKAAAAEMRRRVSEHLGRWAVMAEARLAAELALAEGRPARPAEMRRARTLFAHALETPGGLRIQTVHAFCESLLHRFPLEAGVPFDFAVLEEHDRADMILASREAVLSGGLNGDPGLAGAVETLFDLLSDFALGEAVDAALGEARRLRAVLADRPGAKARLRTLVHYDPAETLEAILARAADESLFPPERCEELFAAMPPRPGRTKNLSLCDKLWAARNRSDRAAVLFEAFLTEKNEPYKDRRMKGFSGTLAERVGLEHDRLAELYQKLRRAELVARSEALVDVLGAIDDRYQAGKRTRSLLDFDDLVARAVALLEDPALGPWVRYKLDAGIDHVLVDESQDTNAEQWKLIRALANEFFVGDSAVERPRTIFAVGDAKQSIFSFQGAEPTLFIETGGRYEVHAANVAAEYRRVPLTTSFRTLPKILEAVNTVFRGPEMEAALIDMQHHETARADLGGTVTLWPPVQQPSEEGSGDAWPTTVQAGERSAAKQVADRIAREIDGWVRGGRALGARGRAVRFEDVLILVQTRNALFREIIRALHRLAIPTPGADRLEVTGHIAVLDLLALGDVVLNPRDDLQLAALLRSPLYDVSEDELFAIARPRGGSLWDALREATPPSARAARDELGALRRALDADRPFEFYAHVLYERGGLRRFHDRFGGEVDDLFSEFLDLALQHEQQDQPSLQGFVSAMRSREVEIKRDLGEAGAGVRVMTVHGAKGLEAPIVVLADAAGKPRGRQVQRPLYFAERAGGPTLVHASRGDAHVEETRELKDAYEAAQRAEYWRKLYVGMTRAEDELYVTGTLTAAQEAERQLEGTWYRAIETALRPAAESIPDAAGNEAALVFPRERQVPAAAAEAALPGRLLEPLVLPPLPERRTVETVRPSLAHERADDERVLETAAAAALDAETARRRGIALHALLQHLSALAPDLRQTAGARALAILLPGDPDADVLDRALGILANPDLAEVFGPASRAEVPFLADLRRRGSPVRLAGRIDRLVVTAQRCMIVDFKSDAVPAPSAAAVREAYVTQLGLYALLARELFPGRAVEAAILWTATESLMFLPASHLREAVEGFTMA